MSILNRIRNAFTGGEWSVAYREKDGGTWKTIGAPENQWCADPFLFEADGEHYLFAEQYRKDADRGCIGYFRFIDGKPVNQGIIIENSFHMSYPDVFRYKDRFYMIPESSAGGTVDLYAADRFPDKWRREKTLISGKKYVDSTVYQDADGFYLISYTMTGGYEIHVYSLDMEKQTVTLLSTKRYERNVGRPGGRLFWEEGRLIRPAQDCSRKYGEALILYQVDDLNRNGAFIEHEVRRIRAGELNLPGAPERTHHLTDDSRYEVMDVYKEKFDLLHAPRIFLRSRRK